MYGTSSGRANAVRDGSLTRIGRRLIGPRIVALGVAVFFAAYWIVYGYGFIDHTFVDANSFWLAAKMAFVEGLSPYTDAFQIRAESTPAGFAHPFVYPPPGLLLLAPLALFDYAGATTALLFASHASLVAVMLGMSVAVHGRAWPRTAGAAAVLAVVVVLVASAQASRASLGIGQVNFVALAGLVWFWAALLGRASFWAGALGLVVLGLLKSYFALIGLVLLLPAGRRMLRPVLVVTTAAIVASLVLLPAGAWADWLGNYLSPMASSDLYLGRYDFLSFENRTLFAALANAPGGGLVPPSPAGGAAMAVAVALQGAALIRHRRAPEALTVPAMALVVLVFLLSPYSWVHYLVYCAGAAGMVALVAARDRAWGLLAVSLAFLLLLLQPSALPGAEWGRTYAPTLGAAIFWAVAIAASLAGPRRGP